MRGQAKPIAASLNSKSESVKKTPIGEERSYGRNQFLARMIALNSSCISSVEYQPESRSLRIRFRSGRSYTLRGVPEYHYVGLVSARSAGRYFNRYLKGRY